MQLYKEFRISFCLQMIRRKYFLINQAVVLFLKRIVLSLQQHAYPASRQISALRVSFLFL